MKPRPTEFLSEILAVRMSRAEMHRLDAMMVEGGYSSRAQLVRSLIRAILDDDARAHGEPLIAGRALHA